MTTVNKCVSPWLPRVWV